MTNTDILIAGVAVASLTFGILIGWFVSGLAASRNRIQIVENDWPYGGANG